MQDAISPAMPYLYLSIINFSQTVNSSQEKHPKKYIAQLSMVEKIIKDVHSNKNINNMIKTTTLCATLLLYLGSAAGYAQQAAASSGDDASGKGGSVSYSVGQVVYTTNTGIPGSVSQGVQQVYKTSIIGAKNAVTISSSVFPNPTSDNVTLQITNYKNEGLTYQLFDMQGTLLKSDPVTGIRTIITTSALPSSTYFLYIIQGNKLIQSFKIIKN